METTDNVYDRSIIAYKPSTKPGSYAASLAYSSVPAPAPAKGIKTTTNPMHATGGAWGGMHSTVVVAAKLVPREQVKKLITRNLPKVASETAGFEPGLAAFDSDEGEV